MSRFATVRWIRGLIPSFIMLFLAACFGGIVFISTLGLPSSVKRMVERELSVYGNVVSIDSLRVSIWAGFVLEADEVTVMNAEMGKDSSLTVDKIRLDFDWSALMNGDFVVDRVELDSVKLNGVLPGKAGEDARRLLLTGFDAVIRLGKNDSVYISKAEGMLQGMKVQVTGEIPLAVFESKAEAPSIDLDELRSTLYEVVGYVDELSWKKERPPVWNINLSEQSSKHDSLRVDIDVRAPELACRKAGFRDFFLNATYAGDVVQIKKISCRAEDTLGMIDAEAALDLATRRIHVDFRSSAPLVKWLTDLTGEKWNLPYHIELEGIPSVNLAAKLEMDENWSSLSQINVIGNASVGGFEINGEPFRKFSTYFNYDNGNFYVSDLLIVHGDDAFTGQVMGEGKNISLDVRSSLSADVLVHLVRSFGDNTFKIPNEFELRGTPDLIAKAKMNFNQGWTKKPEIVQADLSLKLNDFTIRNVEMGTLDIHALISGKKLILERCFLGRENEEFRCSGELDGRMVSFDVKSNFPIQIFDQLLPGMIEQPKELILPASLNIDARGVVFLKEGEGVSLRKLSGSLAAGGIGWNGVVFKDVAVQGSYDEGKIDINNLRLENGKGFFDLAVKGDLTGDLKLSGRNTIGLNEWDNLIGVEDIDFFVKRFKFSDKSLLDLSFEAALSMSNPGGTYEAKATLLAENVEYLGVKVVSGSTSARIVPGKAILSNVLLNYDNESFLASRKIKKGVSSSSLKASDIEFDFNHQTVAVNGLVGTVYPDYVMRMFSPSAAEVLNDFLFTRPVRISGSGVFPLEDDFSRMTSKITFTASSGQIEYPLLGTTLEMSESSGSISISPEWVMVDNLKGKIWGGTFSGKIGARIDKGSDINGLIVLQELDLAKIGASYNEKMNPAIVHGSISFKSRNASLNSIVAHGSAQLLDGNLVEIPLFGTLGKAISAFIPGVGHLVNYNITSASCDYAIEDGYIKSNSFDAKGTNMSLVGGGWIRLSDQQVDSDFKLGLRGLPGLFTSPIFLLAGGFFKVSGVGPLDNISWNLSPFSSVEMNPENKEKKPARKEGKSSRWKFWK